MPHQSRIRLFAAMRVLRLSALWLAIVVLFALYGWVQHERFDSVVAFGAVGIGAACCVIAGLVVIEGVRARTLTKGTAILHLVTAGGVARILPIFIFLGVSEMVRVHGGGSVLSRSSSVCSQ